MGLPLNFKRASILGPGEAVGWELRPRFFFPREADVKPPLVSGRREVFLLLPALRFMGVASSGQATEFIEHIMIHFLKGPLGCSIAIVVGPAPQQWVELTQERLLAEARSGLNQVADFLAQDFYFALCGKGQQLVPIFAHGVPQKIEALVNVGEDRLLL